MNSIAFKTLQPELTEEYLDFMFDILYANMSRIAPTGNTYEEDKAIWISCVKPAIEQGRRNVILILKKNYLVGFFQYYVNETTFMMDEIEFKPEYQGSGIFTELYRYLVKVLPESTHYVESYANKKNMKSQAILKHLGLIVAGENKSGDCYHFRGDYCVLAEKYK